MTPARQVEPLGGVRGPRMPTVPRSLGVERSRRAVWGRRALFTSLLVLVVLALAGVLGVRTGTVSARGSDGLEVRLEYALAARPGLAAPWTLTVERTGGFDGPIVVATSASYLRSFDSNGVSPEPDRSTSSSDEVVWTFEPPPGDALVLSVDARLEPGVQWRRIGWTRVESGDASVQLDYTTWVMP